jgi:flagellar biosynthesis GTPase FlhF
MRRLTSAIALRTVDDGHVAKEFELMESTFLDMIRSASVAYRKDLAIRVEIARKEEEERLRKEAEELERKRKEEEEKKRIEDELNRKRLEEERIQRERQEEQARIEELARSAPEFALVMRQRQENMERKIDNHEVLLQSIFKMLDERLPRSQQPPQP